MASPQPKHAQLTYDTKTHRLIFSNPGEAYLEIGRDKGTDGTVAIVKIPEATGEQTEVDREQKYQILREELCEKGVPIIMEADKPQGQNSSAVCIKDQGTNFQMLTQYLNGKSALSGTQRVASLPARTEIDEEVLSPGARLIDYLKGDEKTPKKVIEESNKIRAYLGESTGHADKLSRTGASNQR